MVKKDTKQKKVRITNCETCAFYTYDDEYGYYVCEADLDEDEILTRKRFLLRILPVGRRVRCREKADVKRRFCRYALFCADHKII